jgi:pimeloyl-ACP methyl ester carboxylesterase
MGMAFMSTVFGVILLLLVGPYLLPLPELTNVAPAQTLTRPTGEFVNLPWPGTDGIQFYYERDDYTGAEARPPVFVLMHGFAANLSSWDSIRPWLAEQGHVIAYDRIPFGLSERILPEQWQEDNPYTDQAAVAQLSRLLDALNVTQAILVGNSAGGSLAMQLALTQPERVQALLLLSPAVYTGSSGLLGMVAAIPPLRRVGLLLSRRLADSGKVLEMAFHDPSVITEEQRNNAAIIARVENWDSAFWEFIRASRMRHINVSERLDELRMPMLLISGDNDRIVATRETVRLASALPTAALEILPECGHLPQQECPEAVLDAIDRWIQTQPATLFSSNISLD